MDEEEGGVCLLSAGSLWSPAVKYGWTSSTPFCFRLLQKVYTLGLALLVRTLEPSVPTSRGACLEVGVRDKLSVLLGVKKCVLGVMYYEYFFVSLHTNKSFKYLYE